jgi:hypothetical protein
MEFFRNHTRIIFVVTIAAFIGVTIAGTVSCLFMIKKNYIAKVNGIAISKKVYDMEVTASKKVGIPGMSAQSLYKMKTDIFRDLILKEITYQQSKFYRITITDAELKAYLYSLSIFSRSGVFDERKYRGFLSICRMTPAEFESSKRKLLAELRLKRMITSCMQLWSYELEEAIKQSPSIQRESLLRLKRYMMWDNWYSNVIKSAEIELNRKSIGL